MKTLVERLVTAPPLAPPPIPSYSDKKSTPIQLTRAFVNSNMHQKTFSTIMDDDDSPPCHMRHVTVHPSLPRVAYCLQPRQEANAASTERHTIVVQDYMRGNTLFVASLGEILESLPASSDKKTKLGSVLRLDFLDAATLFYSGMTTFIDKETTPTTTPLITSLDNRLQALMIQFHQTIVVINLTPLKERRLAGMKLPTSTAELFSSDLVVTLINEATLGKNTPPTTNAVAITPSLLVVGCLDGTLRILDMHSNNRIVKSVRGPKSTDHKKDYLVHLLAVNPNSDIYSVESKQQVRRLIATSHKGIAILWEFVVDGEEILDIRPPVARMEGHTLTVDSTTRFSWKEQAAVDPSSPTHAGVTNSNTESSTEHHSFLEHTVLEYDAQRNLLFWFVPTGYKGSGSSSQRPHLLCWNLSIRAKSKSPGGSIPKHDPFLIVALPKDLEQAGRVTLIAGWLHPLFPDSCVTCAVATHRGDVYVLACSTEGTMANNNKTKNNSAAVMIKDPTLSHHVSISTLFEVPVHVHSLSSCRIQDSSSILVGTNLGLLPLRFVPNDGFSSAGSTLHQYLLEAEAKTPTNHGSVLWVQQSSVYWAPLAKSDKNPVGYMRIHAGQQPQVLYQSPSSSATLDQHQSTMVRIVPRFLKSPSHQYVCMFWQEEERYEILHLPSLLQRRLASQNPTAAYSPSVATGTGVLSFAWVGNEDHFALLYPAMTEQQLLQQQQAFPSNRSMDTSTTASTASVSSSSSSNPPAKDYIGSSGKSRIRKSFNFNKIEKVMQRNKSNPVVSPPPPLISPIPSSGSMTTPADTQPIDPAKLKPRVELKVLVGVKAGAAEYSGSIAAATATTLGHMELRSRQQQPPTTLFGGPVLCVACRGDRDGVANFYTRKPTDNVGDGTHRSSNASEYISSGPTLPYPDLVEWNDDGRLCAVVSGNRVFVYLSDPPNFTLLGTTVMLGGSSAMMDTGVVVTSVKFIHGVLYCATKTSVQCIFLGDVDNQESICHFDSFLLATKDVPCLPSKSIIASDKLESWSPPTIPMALNHPSLVGYLRGSLLVSTVSGLHALPLRHPLLRFGTLLGAGNVESAQKWLAAFPESDHEALASFLERRGLPEMALDQLGGLSIETMVDSCLRHGFTDRLEQIIEVHGLDSLRRIDMGRGIKPWEWGQDQAGHTMVVCVGAYLLGQGKTELVRQLATESMQSVHGKRDAFTLATLLVAVDPNDARRLMKRVVNKSSSDDKGNDDDPTYGLRQWPVAGLIREKLL